MTLQEPYTKLYSQILTSSVWKKPVSHKLVWITLLALKDRGGYVRGSVGWLSSVAGVPLEDARMAIEAFLAPDPLSRSIEHEGRRIKAVEDGWVILNHYKYRDGMETQREKWAKQQRNYRAKKREQGGVSRQYLEREGRFVAAHERGDDSGAGKIAAEGL